MHLASPVILNLDGQEYVAGVAGARLSADFLQGLLKEGTGQTLTNTEWSCSNDEALVCYLLDDTGHILASNQPLLSVEPGDFLGATDPQLMRVLSDEGQGVLRPFVSRNFQALCPDELTCCSLGARSIFIPTLDFLVYLMQNLTAFLRDLGYFLSVALSLLLQGGSSPAEAVSEYGFEVPEGLHRCTTNTTTWSLRPGAPRELHSQMTSECNTSSTTSASAKQSDCRRDLHVYILRDINAILAVADPKCDACFEEPFKDGPVEGSVYTVYLQHQYIFQWYRYYRMSQMLYA